MPSAPPSATHMSTILKRWKGYGVPQMRRPNTKLWLQDKCGIEKTQEKEQRQRRHLSLVAFSIQDKKGRYSPLGLSGVLLMWLICARYDQEGQIIIFYWRKTILIRVNLHKISTCVTVTQPLNSTHKCYQGPEWTGPLLHLTNTFHNTESFSHGIYITK